MMPLPQFAAVWAAIETYLRLAYAGQPPKAVRDRLDVLRAATDWSQAACLERNGERLSLRLGNQFYPHMKLTLDPRPDGQGYLFRADTHDRHCCPPPSSREFGPFCALMQANQDLAGKIETAWADQGLPTFKTFLRDDLERRKG